MITRAWYARGLPGPELPPDEEVESAAHALLAYMERHHGKPSEPQKRKALDEACAMLRHLDRRRLASLREILEAKAVSSADPSLAQKTQLTFDLGEILEEAREDAPEDYPPTRGAYPRDE